MNVDGITGGITETGILHTLERVPVGVGAEQGIVDRAALNNWWLGRAIPAGRYGLRDAMESLNVAAPQWLLPQSLGLSLTDRYGIKPEGSELTWQHINLYDNP